MAFEKKLKQQKLFDSEIFARMLGKGDYFRVSHQAKTIWQVDDIIPASQFAEHPLDKQADFIIIAVDKDAVIKQFFFTKFQMVIYENE